MAGSDGVDALLGIMPGTGSRCERLHVCVVAGRLTGRSGGGEAVGNGGVEYGEWEG